MKKVYILYIIYICDLVDFLMMSLFCFQKEKMPCSRSFHTDTNVPIQFRRIKCNYYETVI